MTKETGVEPLILVVLNALVWQEMLGRELALSLLFSSLFSDENVYANNYDNDEGVKYIPESGRLFNLDFSNHLIPLTSDVHQSKLRRILQKTP